MFFKSRNLMVNFWINLNFYFLIFRKKESYLSAFTELKVVDRALNPDYVLQTCPNLKKLIIDWQEELSQAPFQNYSRNWFCKMIDTPDWTQLLLNLSSLNITFPAAHSPNTGYSCPPEDFVKLIVVSLFFNQKNRLWAIRK